MDYVVGSVAALLSGNVTPSRPKLVRRALTPIKHQPSPNVTPKSEFVDDRSIFLSPTLQKKKAIVKKSPKRIFQNPDLDVTSENGDSNPTSPVADKVKKHLNEELEADTSKSRSVKKSPKNKQNTTGEMSPRISPEFESPQSANENTPKKLKKRKFSEEFTQTGEEIDKTSKKNKKNSESETPVTKNEDVNNLMHKKKNKKQKNSQSTDNDQVSTENNSQVQTDDTEGTQSPKKKSKKKRNKLKNQNNPVQASAEGKNHEARQGPSNPAKTKKKNKNFVNPNAVTNKDSDSEHESDDEIVSENEEANNEILDTGLAESSDEEDETTETKKPETKHATVDARSEDEVKRTVFVGNVPFSKKCKKQIKKLFGKHGAIDSIRIRTVPVKDARVTPKLAVIKNELHPERTTVNVYVKFTDPSSVGPALSENNTLLDNCHLRVSRVETAEHDPHCAVFVGNVPFAIEDEAFRAKFEKCGEINSVRIVRDKQTNAGKGFAYVNFKSKDGVELALALSDEDLTIKNRIMRVKRCTHTGQKAKTQESKGKSFQGKGKNQGGKIVQNRNQFIKKGGSFKQKPGQGGVEDGVQRRLMHKRKNQDGSEAPAHKRPKNLNQPQKEKKTRKEFVGMTAEKKKKHTFNKGQKKRKVISEILTK